MPILKVFGLTQLGIKPESTGVDFGGWRCSLGSDTQGGKICPAPSFFWQVMPTWYSKLRCNQKSKTPD